MSPRAITTAVRIPLAQITLDGDLALLPQPSGLVVFAHGSGSSRYSPRNRSVAARLQDAGQSTLLFDLLTVGEEQVDQVTAHLRFDIDLLAARLIGVTDWLCAQRDTAARAIGYFGASTGAAAALTAAAARSQVIAAVVSRGGRPDLAGPALPQVKAPTLLIVGGRDEPVIEMNQEALRMMRAPARLQIVPGATHLFEEPGALDEVARLAADWFTTYLH